MTLVFNGRQAAALLRAARTDRDLLRIPRQADPARGAPGRAGGHHEEARRHRHERRARRDRLDRPLARGRPAPADLGDRCRLDGPDAPRLAGNVLIWTEGDRTFRLEGDLDESRMLKLGRGRSPGKGRTGAPLRPNREAMTVAETELREEIEVGRGLAGRTARNGRVRRSGRGSARAEAGHRPASRDRAASLRLRARPGAENPALASRSRRLPAESCAGEFPRVHSVAVERHDRPRPVHDPHVRAHAAAGDRGLSDADRLSLGAVAAATGISSSASRSGASVAGIVGARFYHDITSWSEVPKHVVGAVRRLAGRARRLGRNPVRRARRRLGRAPLGPERAAVHGRRRAGAAARAGDRADRATGSTRSSSASRPTCPGG